MNGVFEKRKPFLLEGWQGMGFHGFPPMFHRHAELLYVESGCISMVVEGRPYTLRAGELFILFPYLTHSYQDAKDAQVSLLLFDPAVTAFTNTLLTQRPANPFVDGRPFAAMLSRAVTMLRQGKVKTATGYLNAVLGEFLDVVTLETRPDIPDNTTAQVLEYCSAHFTEAITLKQVADALYLSSSYVSKIFSDKLHYSFREYINSLRIEKAKSLLQRTNLSITAVMDECGFSNQSSFNRIFRDFCGTTPVQFRKQNSKISEKRSAL